MTGEARQVRAELSIRAESRETRRASAWLETAACDEGVPRDQVVRLDHCLDEALANVINHGGPGVVATAVLLQLAVRRDPGACIAELVIVDAGVPFDPCATSPARAGQSPSLAQASIGGLGIAMMRSFSDEIRYRRSGDRNHLTICVRWTEIA